MSQIDTLSTSSDFFSWRKAVQASPNKRPRTSVASTTAWCTRLRLMSEPSFSWQSRTSNYYPQRCRRGEIVVTTRGNISHALLEFLACLFAQLLLLTCRRLVQWTIFPVRLLAFAFPMLCSSSSCRIPSSYPKLWAVLRAASILILLARLRSVFVEEAPHAFPFVCLLAVSNIERRSYLTFQWAEAFFGELNNLSLLGMKAWYHISIDSTLQLECVMFSPSQFLFRGLFFNVVMWMLFRETMFKCTKLISLATSRLHIVFQHYPFWSTISKL